MPAPGQRLIADAQAAAFGAFGHLAQIGGGAGGIVDDGGLDIAAHQQQVRTHGSHDVALLFGPVEITGTLRLRHRLEIAGRLEHGDGEAKVLGNMAHIRGRAVKGEKIVLEYFHPVEADGGGGF